LDRRSTYISSHSRNISKNCIHTKNVYSLVDLNPLDENYIRIKKHTDNCAICTAELNTFKNQIIETKIYIPKPQIDLETRGIFEREVSELFKAFDLNEKNRLKKKIKNKIKRIDSIGEDFIKNLTSRKMLTTYTFGAVLFVVLRQFFN